MSTDIGSSPPKRLSHVERQPRCLAAMVEEDRYRPDIFMQIVAVCVAHRRVEEEIMQWHIKPCAEQAIASGDKDTQWQKVQGLVDVLRRSSR